MKTLGTALALDSARFSRFIANWLLGISNNTKEN